MKSASASGIEYSLIRSRRKTADIVIERDGRVVVRAPETVPAEQIADIVDAKRESAALEFFHDLRGAVIRVKRRLRKLDRQVRFHRLGERNGSTVSFGAVRSFCDF